MCVPTNFILLKIHFQRGLNNSRRNLGFRKGLKDFGCTVDTPVTFKYPVRVRTQEEGSMGYKKKQMCMSRMIRAFLSSLSQLNPGFAEGVAHIIMQE